MTSPFEILVVVDFDGVMHAVGAEKLFEKVPFFKMMLTVLERTFKAPVKVGISSTWRFRYLDAEGFFHSEQVEKLLELESHRVVGCTPNISRNQRDLEIQVLVEKYKSTINDKILLWLCIDDLPSLFGGLDPQSKFLLNQHAIFTRSDEGLQGEAWPFTASCMLASQIMTHGCGRDIPDTDVHQWLIKVMTETADFLALPIVQEKQEDCWDIKVLLKTYDELTEQAVSKKWLTPWEGFERLEKVHQFENAARSIMSYGDTTEHLKVIQQWGNG